MGKDDILNLCSVASFEHKRDLLAANNLLSLIGTAERIDPGASALRFDLRQTGDEQSSAGIFSRDLGQQIVVFGQ